MERNADAQKPRVTTGYKKVKKEEEHGEDGKGKAEYSSSDESDEERVDVEYISLLDHSDDEGDDEGEEKENDDWGAGAPIRVPRTEHIDRQAMVNTDASVKKGKGKAEIKNEASFEAEIKIKDEPRDDDDIVMMDLPSPETKRRMKPPSSPEASRKDSVASEDGDVKPKRRLSSNKKPMIISTTEEREEHGRDELDRLITLKELGASLPSPKPDDRGKETPVDQEGDVPMENTDVSSPPNTRNAETENQIFFFQFPSIMPELKLVEVEPKPEPGHDDAAVAAPDANAPEKEDAQPEPQANTADQKVLPPRPAKPKSHSAILKEKLAVLEAPPPSGMVGQLRVHRSGRMSMIWGMPSSDPAAENPFEMEVNRGVNSQFLQEVVVMKTESPYGDEDVDGKGKRKGVAYSLGQVKGKFVVSPDFGQLIKAVNEKKKIAVKELKVKNNN